jgi:hypothetical protein
MISSSTIAARQTAAVNRIAHKSRFSAISRSTIQPAEVEARLLDAFNVSRRDDGEIERLNAIRANDDFAFRSGTQVFSRAGTYVANQRIAALCREMLLRSAADFALWTAICEEREVLADNEPVSANAERCAFEAMDWIVQPEDDKKVEASRLATLAWLKSGLTVRAFCKKEHASRSTLTRAVDSYCTAIADRLSKAPPRREVGKGNNDHLYRPPGFDPRAPIPFVWHAPLPPRHLLDETGRNPDIAVGLDEIAAGIKRRPSTTLRLIEGGKIPVAKIGGEHVASMKACRAALRTPDDARLVA